MPVWPGGSGNMGGAAEDEGTPENDSPVEVDGLAPKLKDGVALAAAPKLKPV